MRIRVATAALALAVAAAPARSRAEGAVAHPRVLLTPSAVAELRARKDDPDVAAVLAQADRLARRTMAAGYQGEGWAGDAPVLGLAYLLTGEARYARPLLDLLDVLNAAAERGDLDAVFVDSAFASRSTGLAVAIAFDWAYPALGEERRAATVRTVNAYWDRFLSGKNVYERDGPGYGNYFGGHVLGFGAMGYATEGDNPRAPEMVARVRSLFDANVPAAFETGPWLGGFPIEGYVYGGNTFLRLFQYARMVQSATGEAIPGTGSWANRIVETMLHALTPDRWQLVDEGEYTGDAVGFLDEKHLQVLGAVADDPSMKGYARWLLANHRRPPAGSLPPASPILRLLFPNDAAPLDYRAALPTFHRAPGAGEIFMRSDWGDGAVWVSFHAGFKRWTGHVGRQTGHFTVQRGEDRLLVNGHQWKQSKVYRAGRLAGFEGPGYLGNTWVEPTSARTNTLFVDDGPGGYLFDGDRYAGGQGGFSDDQPYAVSQHRVWTYVKLDATRAYANNRPADWDQRAVRSFVRSLAYLSPGWIVVLDRVRVASPSVQHRLSFHLNSLGPPRVDGGTAVSTVGDSRLFLRPLLPADARMTTAWDTLEGVDFVPRIDVQPATPSAAFDALTVLLATGRDVKAMPEVRAVRDERGAMLGAHLCAPDQERVVLFGASGTGPVEGAVAYSVATGRARHHLFDLVPRATYSVAVHGDRDQRVVLTPSATGLAADATGALVFDVSGEAATPVPVVP